MNEKKWNTEVMYKHLKIDPKYSTWLNLLYTTVCLSLSAVIGMLPVPSGMAATARATAILK